jgi:hypothetical protein
MSTIFERLFPKIVGRLAPGMTAAQASEKRCPFVDRHCIVDQCIAWKWKKKPRHWRHAFHERRGRCGAIKD